MDKDLNRLHDLARYSVDDCVEDPEIERLNKVCSALVDEIRSLRTRLERLEDR